MCAAARYSRPCLYKCHVTPPFEPTCGPLCAQGSIRVEQLDLADLASVHAFTKRLLQQNTRIDKLILNAGVMACPLTYTKDGFEMQIGTNNHGHFALAQDLLPHLKSQVGGRSMALVQWCVDSTN